MDSLVPLGIREDYREFLDKIFHGLQELEIEVSDYELDHICYRVSSRERYDYLKENLAHQHTMLSESMIYGRPIANFLLAEPMVYKKRKIRIFELPAPKPFSNYREGFEHVEFVVKGSLENFLGQYSSLNLDLSGFNKTINRDVRISLGNAKVKFHENSLLEIINQESSLD